MNTQENEVKLIEETLVGMKLAESTNAGEVFLYSFAHSEHENNVR